MVNFIWLKECFPLVDDGGGYFVKLKLDRVLSGVETLTSISTKKICNSFKPAFTHLQ